MYAVSAGRVLDRDQVPSRSTLLVLGSLVEDGTPGDYVRGRLDTASALYGDGRVDRIINSGNGSLDAGDEPAVMRSYLEAEGVPARVIVDDPLGLDTAASCRRAREVFGVGSLIIVTQDFHLPRAIALCRDAGVDARGVVAECDCPAWTLTRNHIRETVFAGPKAVLSRVG
ncbi:SanA/YdcF family protein [Gordonia paraffinivorans]|nr:ElyC/SanA/YdcF family protein [Gordonia paraffinivorans]